MKKTRKNLFTYSPNHFFPSKPAFTLAEVLIVIGVIGVVAAITIPTLMANTRGIANKNKFKKAVATFSQAARMSQAKYGFDYAGATHCNSVNDKPEEVNSVCALWNGTLAGSKGYDTAANFAQMYMKYSSNEYEIDDFDDWGAWQLADGTILLTWIPFSSGWGDNEDHAENLISKYCTVTKGIGDLFVDGYGCIGWIDVNGPEGPNKVVSCTNGTTVGFGPELDNDVTNYSKYPCTVSNKDITDQFPVIIHDGLMEPASNAARYVLFNTK